MSDLAVFTYTDLEVRSVLLDDEPWFVAADICRILGLSNPTMAIRPLDEDEKGLSQIETPGGRQQMAIVNESGLYALIVRSDKPSAKPFRKWVTGEVLPAIRKTGRYESQPAIPQTYADALQLAADQARQIEAQSQVIAAVMPKAEAWDHLASATGDYAVADAAKILSRHPLIKVGRDRLFTLMAREGWIYRRQIDQRWTVYQRAVDPGWLTELASSHYHPRTGDLVLDAPQVRVTAKGLAELQKRITGEQTALEAA
jgi:anti-repressor protein